MTIALRAGALALACLLFTVGAAAAAGPAPTFLDDVWFEVRPALLTLIAGLLPILGTWLTTGIVRRLKVARDSDLALSLGRTIDTTLKSLLATKIATGQGAQVLSGGAGGEDQCAPGSRRHPKD